MQSDAEPSGMVSNTVDNPSLLRRMKPPAGYVYVIRDVEISGTYKIGSTSNPAARFAHFDADLPFGIAPVLTLRIDKNAQAFERRLHSRYQQYSKFGEWFRLNDDNISQLREQAGKLLVFDKRAALQRKSAEQSPRSVTYIPPHIYREMPRVASGYLYMIQDEEFTKLFRILWTNDPKRINFFSVRIPFFAKVVHVEPAESAKADELNRRYAEHRRVGSWLDLNDERLSQIRGASPAALAPPPSPQPPAILPTHQQVVAVPVQLPAASAAMPARRRAIGIPALLAFTVCILLAFILGTASGPFFRQLSQLVFQAAAPTVSSVSPNLEDEAICDTSQYECGSSGYILCSSVPDALKPIREGHCLYQHLNDRDNDGKVCE